MLALALLALLASCGQPESRTLRVLVRGADGAPLAGAEVLYLHDLWERPYGGIAVPPLATARVLATSAARTEADGSARIEVAYDGSGGLVVLAEGHAPGGFLTDEELPRAGGNTVLELRRGAVERVRVVVQRDAPPGDAVRRVEPIRDLVMTTWLHNTATVELGHDLQLYAEEVEPGVYAFPALEVVPTLWHDGRSWDVAKVTPIGYSENGAVRGEDGVFVAELAGPPAELRVRYRGGEGLPEQLLVEVQSAAAPPDEAVPADGSVDWPQWYVYGAELPAGGELARAVAVDQEVRSLVFFVHAGAQGSRRFAMPSGELAAGGPPTTVDLTDALRAALATAP